MNELWWFKKICAFILLFGMASFLLSMINTNLSNMFGTFILGLLLIIGCLYFALWSIKQVSELFHYILQRRSSK